MPRQLLEIVGLKVGFPFGDTMVEALKGVDLAIAPQEAVGLVGESGSGKSLTALAIMRLVALPGRILTGEIRLNDRDLLQLPESRMRAIRGREISIVFQDSLTSLNPAFTIGQQLIDVIVTHQGVSARAARKQAAEVFSLVGLSHGRLDDYPHEYSGGMRQRALIAMAVACRPKLLIADEPTTALDVTVQAQIIDLLARLREELGLSMLFITHNLDLMAEICDRAYVLYGGQVMETAPVEELFRAPRHPYSRALIDCIPRLVHFDKPLTPIAGHPPVLGEETPGCPFEVRCGEAIPRCRTRSPALLGAETHRVACWAVNQDG